MKFIAFLIAITITTLSVAQKSVIEGVVKDQSTGETLIGANIVFADNPARGTAADVDGNFKLKADPGTHKLIVSYIGYTSKTITATAGGPKIVIELKSEMLDEIEIVADVAIDRKTPVAFINIKEDKIKEELAGRDLPIMLSNTPGVYATAQGGGDGDAEVKMRGFDGKFIGVLIDGIPINNVADGRVLWSNWFGLYRITRSMQTQRGLGASKLAIPSIGGTINILTKGIENKRSFEILEEVDQYGKSTTSIGINSGRLKGDWSITAAGSYRKGNSWVDKMYTDAYFYFLKVNKRIKNHTLSFTTFGAPEEHIKRSGMLRISMFDLDYAKKQGIPDSLIPTTVVDKGIGYNRNWGYLKRHRDNPNATNEVFHINKHQYFKPLAYIKDFWNINDKWKLYNIGYASIGRGGWNPAFAEMNGTNATINYVDSTGQANVQTLYDANTLGGWAGPPIWTEYSDTEYRSRFVYTTNRRDQMMYGYIGNVNFKPTDEMSFNLGADVRWYKADNYEQIIDMLGGDYFIDTADRRIDYSANPKLAMRYKDDKIDYFSTSYAKWAGMYWQGEYTTPVFSAVLNLTGSLISYKRVDHFNEIDTGDKLFKGWTIKGGANYNITDNISIFSNLGYYDKVQMLENAFTLWFAEFNDAAENEQIKSIELGGKYNTPFLSVRLNGYITRWENTVRLISMINGDADGEMDGGYHMRNVGLDANHMGIELDFTLKPLKKLEINGWVSIGNWKWDKEIKGLSLYNDYNHELIVDLNVTDIYVGGAPQNQFGMSVRYEPIKNLYTTIQGSYFDKLYSYFEPEESDNDGDGNFKQSWRIPSYPLVDFHAGYSFDFPWYDKIKLDLSLNVLNLFDTRYISAAQDNAEVLGGGTVGEGSDAASAAVFFGPPRRIMASLGIRF
jgi:iron complex outermembrane receptor protein